MQSFSPFHKVHSLILVLTLIALPGLHLLKADVIILQDGQRVYGKFHGVSEQGYRITLEDGSTKYIAEEDIADIQVTEEEEAPQSPAPSEDEPAPSYEEEAPAPSYEEDAPEEPSDTGPSSFTQHYFFTIGMDQLQYAGSAELPERIELDTGEELSLKYPTKFSGLTARLGAAMGYPLDAYLTNSSFQFGADLSLGLGAKSDSPLTLESPSSGQSETAFSYSYNYLSLLLGFRYSFSPLYSITTHARLPLSGSYTEKLEQSAGDATESASNKGSLKSGGTGLGLIFNKYWPIGGGKDLGLALFISQDHLFFEGEASEDEGEGGGEAPEATPFSSLFFGIGVSLSY